MISNPTINSSSSTVATTSLEGASSNRGEHDDPIIVDYVSDISDNESIENNTHLLHHINTNQSTFINEINTTTTSSSDNTTTNNINNTTSSPSLPSSSLNTTATINYPSPSAPPQSIQSNNTINIETLKSSLVNNNITSTPSSNDNSDDSNMWSCNICFDTASEPVITQCGHLYCWSCIYRWMQSHSTQNLQCPVCKAGIQQDKLIPIYGRGCSSHTNSNSTSNSNSSNDNIPQRPRGQYTDSRTTPNPNYNPFHNMTNLFGNFNSNTIGGNSFTSSNQFLFADAFRFFPFFDLASGNGNSNTNLGRNHPLVPPPTEQEELQGFVRRLALFLGFILLFYIIFV